MRVRALWVLASLAFAAIVCGCSGDSGGPIQPLSAPGGPAVQHHHGGGSQQEKPPASQG